MENIITINNRRIGQGEPVYIIAEMSANHGQDFNKAVDIIKAAKKAGADAVKLQTYTPDTMTIKSREKYFEIGKGTAWEGRNLYDLYKEAYTPWEWFPKLKKLANKLDIDFFSTPFDSTAVDFLEELEVPAYKIASFEIVDLPLIKYVAKTGKPTIMSTGMADENEIQEAVDIFYSAGGSQLALLKCTSAYPAPVQEMDLNTIPYIADRFKVPAGLSDHTLDHTVPIIAVSLGASIIEKHFTINRSEKSPDSTFSLEPDEFSKMVKSVRITEKALGKKSLGPGITESKSIVFRRSIFAVADIAAGERFTLGNIRIIRPGHGLKPKHYGKIISKQAASEIKTGTPLSWNLIK